MKLEVLEDRVIDKTLESINNKEFTNEDLKDDAIKLINERGLDFLIDDEDENDISPTLGTFVLDVLENILLKDFMDNLTLEFFDKYKYLLTWFMEDILKHTDLMTDKYILNNKEVFEKYIGMLEEYYEPSIEVIRKLNLIDVPLVVEHNCGDSNRVIKIYLSEPDIIYIGCFRGIRDEAVEAISNKYDGEKKEEYIRKVDNCFRKASYRISNNHLDEDDSYQERLTVDFLNKLERIKYHDHYKALIEDQGYDFLDRKVNEFIGDIVIDRLFVGPDKYRNFDYESLENEQKMKLMIEACDVISHDIDQILFAKSAFILHGHTVKESDVVESLGLDLLMELDIEYKELKEMLELVYLGYDENLYSGLENISYAISKLKGRQGFSPGEIIQTHSLMGEPVNQNGHQYYMKDQEYLLEMRRRIKETVDIKERVNNGKEMEMFLKQWGVDLEKE